MSASVDDRIVSLEFDNKQFEKGVSESLDTLDKLKQSLKMDDAAKNLSAISDASRKVDLSTLSDSVDQLSNRFSTLRMVGLMALSNIVDGVMGMAKKVGSALMAPFNQIKTGGWARAMNIEDAKFQLEGLGVAWNKISDDVNYGVADTAYGLDAAAKAASQLVASGVKFGDTYGETGNSPMSKALRGISGVAAMTNSSYEDISSIFTTVAGQGKLMTMQLRQLEARGLNAAATLGTQLGKSEAEIRDMVTKGKIDFETFSMAMDDAFGKHATDANNTFAGAMSNIKAALSRIGAEFATPFIHSAVPVLNAVRNMINAIKGNMGDVFTIFERLTTVIGDVLAKKINNVTHFLKNDFTGLKNFGNALYIVMNSIVRIAKTVADAFGTVFDGSMGDHVNNMAVGMEKLAKVLYPTDEALQGFRTVLVGLFSVIKAVGTAIGWLVTHIGGPLLSVVVKVLNVIFSLIGKFGQLVSIVVDVVKNFDSFDGIVKALKDHGIELGDKADKLRVIFDKVKSAVQTAGTVITSVLKGIGIALAAIVAVPIYLLYTAFQKLISLDWSKFVSALTNAKNLVIQLFEKAKQLEIVKRIVEGITTAFFALVGGIAYVGNAIGDFFVKLANGEITLDSIKAKIETIPDSFKNIGQKLKNNLLTNTVFPEIQRVFGRVGTTISGWVTNLKGTLEGLTPAKVMLVAFSLAITAFAITANKVSKSVISLVDNMSDSISTLTSYFTKQKSPLDKFKEAILTVTTAIAGLALAMKLLSTIPNLKEVAVILGIFILIMGMLPLIVGGLAKILKINTDMKGFVQNMAMFAIAIATLSGALLILSKVPLEGMLKRFGILTLIIMELIGATVILGEFGPQGIGGALGMVGFALAILALGHVLQKLDGMDFKGIKGSWKELTVIILGMAVFCRALGSVGIALFTGAIAFILAAKLFANKLEDLGEVFKSTENSLSKPVETLKMVISKVFAGFDEICEAIKAEAEKLGAAKTALLVLAIVGIVAALVLVGKKIASGASFMVSNGKSFKKMAVAIAILAATVAAMVVFAKQVSAWIKEDPGMIQAMEYLALGLIVVGGVAALLVGLSGKANEEALKYVKKLFTSLAIVMLAMAAFMAITGDLDAAQWERANTSLMYTLVIIGIFATVISAIDALTQGNNAKSTFGKFAGITLIFGMILGALAGLMIVLNDEDDYKRLGLAVGAIFVLLMALAAMFAGVGKIRVGTAWKPILALVGAAVIIAGAIVGLTYLLPDEGYIGKIVAISASMILVLGALIALAGVVTHFAKSSKFSVTDKSERTLKVAFKGLAELIAGILVVAVALALLQKADPKQLALTALLLTGTVLALLGLLAVMKLIAGKVPGDADKVIKSFAIIGAIFTAVAISLAVLAQFGGDTTTLLKKAEVVMLILVELTAILALCQVIAMIPGTGAGVVMQLAQLTLIFAALGILMVMMDKIGADAISMLKNSQVIMLVLVELTAILALCQVIAMIPGTGAGVVLQLVALTAIFAALAAIMIIMEKIGADAISMLKNSQVIMLVLVELTAILALCQVIAMIPGTGAGVVLQLAALTAIFAALAAIMVIMEKIGADAISMLKNSQVIMLVLVELTAILALCQLIAMIPGTGAGVVLQLAGLTVIFGLLAVIAVVLSSLDIDGLLKRTQIMILVMTELVALLTIMSLIGMIPGVSGGGMLAAAASLLILSAALIPLAASLLLLEGIQFEQLEGGLKAIAAGLGILLAAGALAAVVSSGLTTLSLTIIALGVGCVAAGAGVLLFANGIQKLASTTPGQLQMLISVVRGFFTALGQGIANGLQAIITVVVNGIKLIKTSALTEAKGFVPDLIKALFNTSGVETAATKSGASIGNAWVKGFRNSKLGWHSPPEIIDQFKADVITGISDGENVKDAFMDAARTAGNSFADELTGTLGGFDLSSLGNGMAGDLFSGLLSGSADGIGNWQSMLDGALNYFGHAAKEMQNSIAGLGTLSDFAYQQQEKIASLRVKISEAEAEVAKWDSYSKSTSTNSYYTSGYAAKKYLEAKKNLSALNDEMKDITSTTAEATEQEKAFTTALGGVGGAAKSTANDLKSSLQSTLESQLNIFDKFEAKAAMSKQELLNNMKSQINGMLNWAGQMDKLATLGIDKGLYQKLAEMGPQGAQYVGAFASMTAEEMAQANEMWAQSLTLPGDLAGRITSDWAGISKDMVGGLSKGWTDSEGQFHDAALLTSSNLQKDFKADNDIHSPSGVYKEIGYNIIAGLRDGIWLNRELVLGALRRLCQMMQDSTKADLDRSKFVTIGTDIVSGLVEGLEKDLEKVKTAAKNLGKATEEATRESVDGHSPARVFIAIGRDIDEGLAIGITRGTGGVVESMESVSNQVIEGMKYTVATIATTIQDGIEDPVITPVLDLSRVNSGIRTLNNAFSTQQALNAAGSMSTLQNGQSSGGVNFIQNNYSPKPLSRTEIYRQTNNQLTMLRRVAVN